MVNTFELIGRLVDDPIVRVLEDGVKVSNIRLAVTRPFKNSSGEYGVDYIPVSLWYSTAIVTEEFCSKGDLVFVKGRISSKIQTIEGKNYQFFDMIGERIVFLSPKSSKEAELVNEKISNLNK